MQKTILRYGLISGIVAMTLMMITMSFHDKIPLSMGLLIGYIGITLSFIVIYPAMVSYRDKVGNGTITFGRSIAIGLLISLVSGFCYVIAWAIIYKTMMPDFMDKYAATSIEAMKKAGKSAAEINKAMQSMEIMKEDYKNPVWFTLYTLMEPLPVGIIITFISALIIRAKSKKNRPNMA